MLTYIRANADSTSKPLGATLAMTHGERHAAGSPVVTIGLAWHRLRTPAGNWIGFRGDTFSQQTGSIVELYRIAPDGTQLKKLTGPETLALDFNWSPDSTKIAFVDDYLEIDVIEADGTGLQTLATDPVSLGLPDWQALP